MKESLFWVFFSVTCHFLSIAVVVEGEAAIENDNIVALTKTSLAARKLQTTNFKVTYKARYQHLADPNCSGPAPIVRALCNGVINPLTISDGSIRCTAASQDGWSGIECRTTCEETNTCGDIYLERDDVEGGVFAEITYECLGETTQQIDTTFQYTSGADGVCEEGQISGRNFHVAQLGVLCSAENGQQEFDYGDRYFECGFGNFAFKHDGKYTCIAGQNCQGQPCEVAFEELTVEASSERFHECIESVSGIPVPEEPTDEEIRSPSVPGDYVATFEAKWQLSLDLTYCGAGFASKKITCVGGNISLTETLYDNIACSQISEDVLECSDTSDANFVNAFSGIIFTCSANQIPESRVEFSEGQAACQTSLFSRKVSHLLQLGIFCTAASQETFVWDNDYSFECGEDNDFEIIDGRYTCKSAFNFGSGSQSTDIRPIPVLEMFVDPATWPSSEFDNCYEFAPADGTSPPTTNTTDGNEAGPGEESPCLETGFGDCDQPGTTAPSSSATPSPTPAFTGSDDTTYKATYSARFKHILNEGCEGPSPDVVPFCVNGDIQLLATSDPTIRCSDPVQLNGTTTGALCSNTCSGTECESVFVDVDGTSFSVYGEITFECEGSMVDAARGGVVILGSDTGTCDGSANDMDNFGLNIMIGQLGVFCTDQYVFDDRYAECGLGSIPSDLDLGSYQCLSGRRCTDSCTVSINDIEISADHFRFPECIESSDGSAIPEINIPTIEPLLVGSYTAIFSSNYLVSTSELGGCTISVQGQRISCLDGEIRGPLVDPNFVICEKASNSIIECTGADDAMPINALENIIYECSSNKIPETKVEFFEVETTCFAESQVQLGILCGDPGSDQTFAYLDFFVECGASNEFAQIDGNFTCTESTSASGEIAEVEIETDYRWALVNDRCYTFKENVTLPPLPPTPLPTSAAPQPTADTTIYSASYTARFKHILDEGCQGPVPEIVVLCETGILEILGTSDPSITCIGPLALNASSAALCSITCVGDECNSVYIDAGATNPDIYGGVIFQCQGPNVNGVKAQAGILGSDTGSCDSGSGSGINVMLVQLGVFCADEGDYIFDDQHAECAYPGSNPINIGGEYHCFSGRVCGGDACSVPINEILVIADHYRFPECIETSDGSVISQIDLPTSEPIAPGSYTGFFASNTRIILSEITSGNDCVVHATGQRVTCVNGNIRLIDPGFMSCEVVADDAIECTELNGVTPTNKWGSVIYECRSNSVIPETVVDLYEVETTCSAESQLQLGVYCGEPGSDDVSFLYLDLFVECGEGNEFDSIDGNYTCKDSTLVSSFASEPGTIPPVEIFTDYRWALLTDGDLCKFYKEDSTAAPTVLDDGDGFNVPPASFFNDTTPTTSSSNSSSSIDSPAQAPLAMPVTAAPTTLVNASSLTNPPTQFTNDSSSQEEQATSSSSSSSATKAIYPVAAAVLLLLCRLESS